MADPAFVYANCPKENPANETSGEWLAAREQLANRSQFFVNYKGWIAALEHGSAAMEGIDENGPQIRQDRNR